MASVTQRISQIKQPYGGYLPLKSFSKAIFDDGFTLNESENIHASLVGMAVDYLTRFLLGDSVDKAFHISCLGASNIGMLNKSLHLCDQGCLPRSWDPRRPAWRELRRCGAGRESVSAEALRF